MFTRFAAIAVILSVIPLYAADAQVRQERKSNGGTLAERIAEQGVQVGEPMPNDLKVYDVKGEEKPLAPLWQDKPTLLVTASITCPVARNRQKQVAAIAERFGDKLNIVMLYTVEAHPEKDPSPYGGKVWEHKSNARDGTSRRQPTSLEGRCKLAQEYAERLGVKQLMAVDAMNDAAWKAVGGGPNLGLLIDRGGRVAAKQPWLNPEEMSREIEKLLKPAAESKPQK